MSLLPPPPTAPGPKAHVNIYHSLLSLKLLFWPQPIKKLLPPHSTGPDCKHSTRKLQQNGKTGKYRRQPSLWLIFSGLTTSCPHLHTNKHTNQSQASTGTTIKHHTVGEKQWTIIALIWKHIGVPKITSSWHQDDPCISSRQSILNLAAAEAASLTPR